MTSEYRQGLHGTSYHPLDIEGQRAGKAKQRTAQHEQAEEHAADVRWFMGDARGRRLMWGWLAFMGLYRTPFAGEAKNQTNFNLGLHNAGLMLNNEINKHCPEQVLVMTNEATTGESHA